MIEEKIKYILTSDPYINKYEIFNDLAKIKDKKIILNYICNSPLMALAAEVCFALRMKGIFSYASEEAEDISSVCNSLIIGPNNISAEWFQGAYIAVKTVRKMKKSVILDLEKTNLSWFRLEIARQILEAGVNIIKGNYEEIINLESTLNKTDDSELTFTTQKNYTFGEANKAAQKIAKKYNLTVIAIGYTSFITDGKGLVTILNNPNMLKLIPGIDHALTSLIAAFGVIEQNCLKSAAKAILLLYLIAETLEEKNINKPSIFQTNLVDLLSTISVSDFPENIQCYYVDVTE